MDRLRIVDHPLLQHKLSRIRDKKTGTKDFRELVRESAIILAVEATAFLNTRRVKVETPLAVADGVELERGASVIIPVLRAGLTMVDGFLEVMPNALIGHVGLYRDPHTHVPVEYYTKVPAGLSEKDVFLLDPMLATGGSAASAIDMVKREGATSITLVCLIAAPEGLKKIEEFHPDVPVFTASVDEKLDERDYIIPGLGDAGDRLFGTE